MPDVKFSNKYPYTDFHELNLDWIIKEVKYWSERVGKTIQSIELTGSAGLVDTYTINYSDGTTSTFNVTNGNGIASVAKTGTAGLVDTYTITFTDGSTSTFEVNNGTASIDPTLSLSDYAADAKATGDAIDNLKVYVGIDSSRKSVTISSLVASSATRRRTSYLDAAAEQESITVGPVAGFQHNINYFQVTVSDGVSEVGWQTDETTFKKPDNNYKFWWVNFRKADNSSFSAADEATLIAGLDIHENFYSLKPNKSVYVSTAGSDSNDGSQAAPFATLRRAVDSGASIIRVAPGNYTGVSIFDRTVPLTIMLDGMPANYSPSVPDVPKIKITTGLTDTGYGIYAKNCAEVRLFDIWVDGMAADCMWFESVGNIYCERCYASNNAGASNSMGFRIINCNGTFKDCLAWNINKDGFNIHKYGNTEFINCVAHDCGDDGISHHDGCTGLILGGEYYNCYKGGVSSPYGGAKIDIHNVYIHDCTQYGIYSISSAGYVKSAGRISNCVIKDNGTYDIIADYTDLIGWHNIYDTKSVGSNATFTEIS